MTLSKILVVDDDQCILDTISMYLGETMQIITAKNGRQAVEYMSSYTVDLILLDVEMPIMNGFITLEQLRNLKNCINVPVIMITGKNDKNTVIRFMSKGVDDYIIKPIDKSVLIEKVNALLKRQSFSEEKKTVLTVDDDMNYLKTIHSYLCDEYNVIMINSSKLALEYLAKYTPDIILLDYNMPLYNGTAVMNHLNKDESKKEIPIIIVSGNLDMELMQECVKFSPSAYIVKPVTKDKLKETIKNVLNQHIC